MMRTDDGLGSATSAVLERDEVESVLSGAFYSAPPPAVPGAPGPKLAKTGAEKPAHYKVICISLYTRDLEELDRMVDELKARGLTKASRSALIRFALSQVDLDQVPRGI